MQESKYRDFAYLQKQIHQLTSKFGSLEKVSELLDDILNDKNDHDTQLSLYITICVANHFNISVNELINEGGKVNSSYRMICYKLHKETLDNMSIRKIGAKYARKENTVFLAIKRMNEIIKDPKYDKDMFEAYKIIEVKVLRYKSYLHG